MQHWKIHYNNHLCDNNPELVRLVASIATSNKLLSGIPLPPSKRSEMMSVALHKHIHSTTAIEGNQLTLEQVRALSEKEEYGNEDELEAFNILRAIEFIESRYTSPMDAIIDIGLIKRLHAIITKDITNNENIPGQYRKISVIVGRGETRFEPVGFEAIQESVQTFVEYINSPEMLACGALIRAVAAHFYLVTIHPFADGNGRVSRALEALILYAGGFSPLNHFSISNFYVHNYNQYFKELNDARFKYKGDLTHFALFALSGFLSEIEQLAQECLEFINRKFYYDYAYERLRYGELTSRGFSVLEKIYWGKAVTRADIFSDTDPALADLFKKVTKRTRERDIKKLLDLGLVKWNGEVLEADYTLMNTFKG